MRNPKYKKTYDAKIPLDRNFQKIVQFYLFECPVENTSVRGKKFKDLGWSGAKLNTLKSKLLNSATQSLKGNYFPCKKDVLPSKLAQVEAVHPVDEYCVFLKYDEKNKVMSSLFSAIRNALAHGSFAVRKYQGTRIYFFANYDGYLKAEMVLHESTLLSWSGIIRDGENSSH